jgi:putative effector of murein hydrolase LrgA (UPF0299 family)
MRQPIEIRQPAAIGIYVVGFTLFFVGALVLGIISSPSDAPILGLMMAFGIALGARIQMLKFVADESGILIRNFFRTWRFG